MFGRNRMHSKNIYKSPPNFNELAIAYPDFRKYVKAELSGRLTIDYNDPRAVKELTKTLLKKDFDLDVEISEDRLIPRVPLCLNYILWIEDLLSVLGPRTDTVGIDIGTGNVCIYSLLAARRGWKMLATELDPFNVKNAQRNITKNNLNEVISLKSTPDSKHLLLGILDDGSEYDFCMCNPPFFDYSENPVNRTQRRAQLPTVASHVKSEICTDGGEVLFVSQLIEESLQLRDRVKIYTTLVGKKCDFLHLRKKLQTDSIKSVAFTEFCQGRTTRWGMAWSFLNIPIDSFDTTKNRGQKKRKGPSGFQFVIPENKSTDVDVVYGDTINVLRDLEITYKNEQVDQGYSLSFKALKNTWSHQRRKKRLEARTRADTCCETGTQQTDSDVSPPKKPKTDPDSSVEPSNGDTVVEGLILLRPNDSSIVFELIHLSGNKECLHQILQYFKNHWNNS